MSSELNELLEKLAEYAGREELAEQISLARKVYFNAVGEIKEEETNAEQELVNFLEWFLFDCKLDDGKNVLERFEEDNREYLSEYQREILACLSAHFKGIYRLEKVKKESVVLKDLITKKSYKPVKGLSLNLKKGDVFLARLVKLGDCYYLTQGFHYLPYELMDYVSKSLKLLRKDKIKQDALLNELRIISMKVSRYPRLKVKEFLSEREKKSL